MSKLLKTMLGAVALTYCVSAHAKPFTNEDAIAEAKSYKLIWADHIGSDPVKDKKRFVKEYQNAYAGDYVAWRNVSNIIWKYHDKQDVASQIAACAWQSLVVQTKSIYKNPLDDFSREMMCGKAAQTGQVYAPKPAVQKKIAEIKKIIDAHTVHLVNIEEIDFDAERDRQEAYAGLGWDYKY
ncbi:hypothetical protein [Aristophania vespae]|uniref:hypothetical protein n=1 Tax=Aristophania vespae TaxID=2697033 RepID=UPI002351B4CA|nr:hypothetical protein [Aristophania vespae]UMM63813.1 hypothetical protein DM15PD_07900 [Aristophania vespae]